jgi:hypothetical protein
MAYLNPMVVSKILVKTQRQHMEDYILNFLWTFQNKEYIFLPYNF